MAARPGHYEYKINKNNNYRNEIHAENSKIYMARP
jgi:hypothetical protein